MEVKFKSLAGITFKVQLPPKATVFDACKSLSRIFKFSHDHIHLISVNQNENKRYYGNEDRVIDILRNGSQYIFFMVIPKILKVNGVLGSKRMTTRHMKHICKNVAINFSNIRKKQNNFQYSSIIYRDYYRILRSTPRDLQSRINQVAQLGYQIEDIKEALRSAHFDVQLAINILISMNNGNNDDTSLRGIRRIHELGLRRFSAFNNQFNDFEDDQYDFIHAGFSRLNRNYAGDNLLRISSFFGSNDSSHNDVFLSHKDNKNSSYDDGTHEPSNSSTNMKNNTNNLSDQNFLNEEPILLDEYIEFYDEFEAPINKTRSSQSSPMLFIDEEASNFEPKTITKPEQTNSHAKKHSHNHGKYKNRKTPPPKRYQPPPPQNIQKSQSSQDQIISIMPKHDSMRKVSPINNKNMPNKPAQPPQIVNSISLQNNTKDFHPKNQIRVELPTHLPQSKQLFSYSKPKQVQSPPPPPALKTNEILDKDEKTVKDDPEQEEEEDPEIQKQKTKVQPRNVKKHKFVSSRKFQPKTYDLVFEDDD